MFSAAPRNKSLDLLVSICALWSACGFLLDTWAHGHVPVETFFTPYHGVAYSGIFAGAAVLAIYGLRGAIPKTYRMPMLGIPLFLLSGLGDLAWHTLLGIEEGVDAVLSPTHIGLGIGILLISSAPIVSALRNRDQLRTLGDQLPLIFSLAAWLELLHFGTAYAFDPGAGALNAPPSTAPFTPDYLTALSIGYYKLGTGVLIVIFQSLLMSGFALFAGSRFALRAGALTLLFLLGNCATAAAFTNQTSLLAAVIAMSLAGGIAGDVIVGRMHPAPERPLAYRLLAICVPVAYFAAYFIVTGMTERLWWDWNVVLGSVLWAGGIGFGLSLLSQPRTQSA
ncbi:MAG TPA: hypothetical protein VIO32_02805 [Candidatus Baltobacteraceae bacterium]